MARSALRSLPFAVVAGIVVELIGPIQPNSALAVYFALLALIVCAVVIHEAGHAVMGWTIGWDLQLSGIGPVVLRFRPFSVRLGRIPGLTYFGWVLAAPPRLALRTRTRTTLFYLGGAAANLLFSAILILAVMLHAGGKGFAGAAIATAAMSLFVGIGSLVPAYKRKQPRTDGAKIIALFRARQTLTEFDITLAKVASLYQAGIPPSTWNAELVAALDVGHADDSKCCTADIYLFEHYFFTPDYRRARDVLDRAIARSEKLPILRNALHIADAFFSGFVEQDAGRAERALALVNALQAKYIGNVRTSPQLDTYAYERAVAAIQIAKGDRKAALQQLGKLRLPLFRTNPFLRPLHRQIRNAMVAAAQRLPISQHVSVTT